MSLIESQYEQIAQELRNYEIQMYVTPATLLTVLGVALEYSIRRPDDFAKLALTAFLVILCHAFTVLFAKQSIHQRALREALGNIEAKNPDLIKLPRTTSFLGNLPTLERSSYDRNTPLWLYFSLSADKMIMWMLMATIVGTFTYFNKTLFDLLNFTKSEMAKSFLAVAISLAIFLIYWAVLSRDEEAHKSETETQGSQNSA